MKVKIVDFGQFKASNGYEFARDVSCDYILNVYATMTNNYTKYVLLYLPDIQVLGFFKLNSSLLIVDSSLGEHWVIKKNYCGGDYLNGYGGLYFKKIRYKEVKSPEWMILDRAFFLELYETPNIAKEKFFHHEGISMIK